MEKRLNVFISYSWDSQEHKDWVLKLADYLTEKAGCHVILDQYDLAAGKELTHFMENGLEKADKVLIILTEEYKKRAMNRKGGTGFESSMISQGLYELQTENNKFIPILRQGTKETSAPIYIGTKVYISMKDDSKFEMDAFKLSREIYEKPEIIRPKLGAIPNFNNPDYDPIIAVANDLSKKENLNKELNQILESTRGVELAKAEAELLYHKIEEKAKHYTKTTVFVFKTERGPNGDSLLVSSVGYTVTFSYRNMASNWAKENTLTVKFWNGYMSLNHQGYIDSEMPKLVKEIKTRVDLNNSRDVVWRVDDYVVLKSENLIQKAFVFIIESIKREKEENFRKGN